MFIDARRLPNETVVETEVCIVGAGAAGISLAREFIRHPFRVCLLEAGGLKFDDETQALYRGENVGLPYEALHAARFRYFGGSTKGWGGWCKPLDHSDFERRDWVPHSGWPITRSDLDPYYERAQEVCHLGPFDYDIDRWQSNLGNPPLGVLPLADRRVVTEMCQLSPPTHFGKAYREEIRRADNLRAYLYTNAVRIETTETASVVTGVRARTLGGNELIVRGRIFILATGGIENARLLLLSNQVHAAGLGNRHDLVGRFFMDHPCLRVGNIVFSDGDISTDFYDPFYKFRKRARAKRAVYHRTLLAGSVVLAEQVQRNERLLNYEAWIVSMYRGDESRGMESLRRLYLAMRGKAMLAPKLQDVSNIVADFGNVCSALYGRFLRPKRLVQRYQLVNIIEPDPDPESRVTLSSERDRLGLNCARLNWRVGPLPRRTLSRAQEILNEELARAGLGRLENQFVEDDDGTWLSLLRWVWHHMGTTRMHDDPKQGVVDVDCRVHGISNLFIAGSSVFPTAGKDMPTLTIVALALRLADHVKRLVAAGEVVGEA